MPAYSWSRRYGTTYYEEGRSISAALDGGAFVTGILYGTAAVGGRMSAGTDHQDIFVLRLDRSGNQVWSRRFGSTQGFGYGFRVAATADGGVLVTGGFSGTLDFGGGALTAAGDEDIFVLKLDSAGSHRWSRHYGGGPQTGAAGLGISATPGGGALVTGAFQGTINFGGGPLTSAGNYDIFVLKLDAAGNHVWSRAYGSNDPPGNEEVGWGVSATSGGGALVTGAFSGTVDFGGGPLTSAGVRNIFVLKLDASGSHVWSHGYGSTRENLGVSVSTTPDQGALVTGVFSDAVDFGGGPVTGGGWYNAFVLKLDSAGNHVWSRGYGGADYNAGLHASAAPDGSALVTGYFQGTVDFGGGPLTSAGGDDVFVMKLDGGGHHVWSRRYGSTGSDEAWGVSPSSDGSVYLTGYFYDTVDFGGGPLTSAGQGDVFVLKLVDTSPAIATISGRVVDGFNWRDYGGRVSPITRCAVDATDLITQAHYSATTDTDGNFLISVPGNASYECTFTHPGYRTSVHATGGLPSGAHFTFPLGALVLDTKTVVLLHGLWGGARSWVDQNGFDFAAQLRASLGDWNVEPPISLVPDPLGWLDQRGSVNGQVGVLADYLSGLDAQGIRSVKVVGHSMGGLVARQYIRTHPGKIETLVMLGTPNHGSELATYAKLLLLWAEGELSGQGIFSYVPPAGEDLVPDSPLLRDLNYNGEQGLSNWGCPQHPAETTLSAKTRYYTYTGTAFEWNFWDACDRRWWFLGSPLATLTTWPPWEPCDNDYIVPVSSVPLRGSTPPLSVHNWTDIGCGCFSRHLRTPECPPMKADPCVVRVVTEALEALPSCTLPASASVPLRGVAGPVGQNAGFDLVFLAPGGGSNLALPCGSADSLEFRADLIRGTSALTLIDPTGRRVNPDSAAVDPNIDYQEDGLLRRYVVRSGAPGEWQLVADAANSPDSVEVLLTGTEYGQVAMTIGVADAEVTPEGNQKIEATLRWLESPLLGASVAGIVRGPSGFEQPVVLVDDGTAGDRVPGDGVYTVDVGSHPFTGQYDVSLLATGTYGAGRTLNRSAARPYFVSERPDLQILEGDIELSAAVVDTQSVVTVTATVRNIGGAAAESVRAVFLEEESGLLFGERSAGTLGAGQEVVLSADWPTRHGASEYRLGARVSVGGTPGETDIANNEAYATPLVVVGAPEDTRPGDQGSGGTNSIAILRLSMFPNPVRGDITIRYQLPRTERVRLDVFDVAGRRVRTLLEEVHGAGLGSLVWDGRDGEGHRVTAGVYFVRLRTQSDSRTGRIVLIR
ncbi:MAG: alpha/beta fold hydrolase [bacterium]